MKNEKEPKYQMARLDDGASDDAWCVANAIYALANEADRLVEAVQENTKALRGIEEGTDELAAIAGGRGAR